MNSPRIKNEGWLYGLAFLIALGFRLIQLSAAPLTDSEARLALQAFHLSQGARPLLGPQPAYILLTTIFFAIFGAFNFWARFVPAIVGSALVFFPYLFRERINSRVALILAFMLAIDPGFVALSRQANGTILAVTFTLFAWAMLWNKNYPLAGVFGGLALLSGPSLWAGALGLGLTWAIRQGMETKAPQGDEQSPRESRFTNNDLRISLAYGFSSFLLIGTLFFTLPSGLGAAFASIPAYLKGWVTSSNVPAGRVLFALIAYEPLFVILGVVSIIRGLRIKSKRTVRLGIWLGVSLLLALSHPARQTADLIWPLIPLLTLSALELNRSIDLYPEERMEVGVTVVSIMLLLTFSWLKFAGLLLNPSSFVTALNLSNSTVNLPAAPYLFILVVLAILILCILLVALGWSIRTARLGTIWSLIIFLGMYTLGGAWSTSGTRYPTGVELWIPDSRPAQPDLLLATANDLSRWSAGHTSAQPVTVMGIDSPALKWTLRDYKIESVDALDPASAPPLVVTPPMQELGLPAAYRGQDFTWRQEPIWDVMQPSDWFTWIIFRKLPQQPETIILWARADLFPDGKQNP